MSLFNSKKAPYINSFLLMMTLLWFFSSSLLRFKLNSVYKTHSMNYTRSGPINSDSRLRFVLDGPSMDGPLNHQSDRPNIGSEKLFTLN